MWRCQDNLQQSGLSFSHGFCRLAASVFTSGAISQILKKKFVWLVGWYTPCIHVRRSEDNPWKFDFFSLSLCGFQGSNCGPQPAEPSCQSSRFFLCIVGWLWTFGLLLRLLSVGIAGLLPIIPGLEGIIKPEQLARTYFYVEMIRNHIQCFPLNPKQMYNSSSYPWRHKFPNGFWIHR